MRPARPCEQSPPRSSPAESVEPQLSTYVDRVAISTMVDEPSLTSPSSMNELLIATNPDPDSTLAYLLRVPLGEGIVLRTAGTWPRTKALYCYPVLVGERPAAPDIVERVPLRSCTRRGAAIDIVAARARENRSQLVFTTARGREAVFWQSPRT